MKRLLLAGIFCLNFVFAAAQEKEELQRKWDAFVQTLDPVCQSPFNKAAFNAKLTELEKAFLDRDGVIDVSELAQWKTDLYVYILKNQKIPNAMPPKADWINPWNS